MEQSPIPVRSKVQQRALLRSLHALPTLPQRLDYLRQATRDAKGKPYSYRTIAQWCTTYGPDIRMTGSWLQKLCTGEFATTEVGKAAVLARFFRVRIDDLHPAVPPRQDDGLPDESFSPGDEELAALMRAVGVTGVHAREQDGLATVSADRKAELRSVLQAIADDQSRHAKDQDSRPR